MSVLLRILLIAGAIIMMAFMLKRIRYAKLKIEIIPYFGWDFQVF